jgi:hypothetical protein
MDTKVKQIGFSFVSLVSFVLKRGCVLIVSLAVTTHAIAQQNHIDTVTPAAPELASYGKYAIGVRTMQVTDKNRPDILNTKEGGPTARYDRTLTLEVWYPAALAAGQKAGGEYRIITRDPAISATVYGGPCACRAARDRRRVPLVIISHGYPGNRYLMSHLGENLASKGFVAVSIVTKTAPTTIRRTCQHLYNRPFDQLFVLNDIERLGKAIQELLQRAGGLESHRPRRLLDGRLRRGERDWRRLQQGQRNAHRCPAEQAARTWRREPDAEAIDAHDSPSKPRSPSLPGA